MVQGRGIAAMAGTSEGAPISIAAAIAPMDSSAVMFHVPCRDHRVRNLPLFQKQAIILLSGVPATGKSEFARHLARECGFAHYDLECHPRGWPHPELKATWDASRSGFVAQLRQYHERIVLDWGFPPSAVPWVEELRRSGAKLVWFDGDIARAQQVFVQRGGSRWNVLTDKSRPSTKQDTRHHFSASSCPLCPPPEPSWLSARLKG